jgi:hypothetical protein
MKKDEYTLFVPPNEVALKSAKDWTVREAERYFSWLVGSMDARVEKFLTYFGEEEGEQSDSLLLHSGTKLEHELLAGQHYVESIDGRRLSSSGYAMAADAGLLLARCLLRDSRGALHWRILERPRSAQSFNLPVLVGFSSRVEFDPVAASIAQATGVIRGTDRKDRWLRLYQYWSAQAQSSIQES